jgi:hypothetical protein
VINNYIYERFYFDVIKKWSLLKMKTIEDALAAERFIYNNSFFTSRWVSAKANGKLLEISAMNIVLEATYFPSRGPDSD